MWLDITVAVVFTSVLCQGLCSDRKGKFPVFLRKNSIAYESMGRRLTHAFFRGWENINICTWFVIDQAIMIRIFRVLAQTFINNASHCDNGHVGLWEGASKPRDLLAAAQISPHMYALVICPFPITVMTRRLYYFIHGEGGRCLGRRLLFYFHLLSIGPEGSLDGWYIQRILMDWPGKKLLLGGGENFVLGNMQPIYWLVSFWHFQ